MDSATTAAVRSQPVALYDHLPILELSSFRGTCQYVLDVDKNCDDDSALLSPSNQSLRNKPLAGLKISIGDILALKSVKSGHGLQ